MEITYLTQLNNYPSVKSKKTDYVAKLKSTPIDEITSLENLYNNGRPFPKALRELLYIAGEFCYLLDYGFNDTQTELQESVREDLIDYDLSIARPFYVIDIYNAHDMCLFIYLDEDTDDPIVYEAVFSGDPRGWLHSLNVSLSQYINERLVEYLRGENPF